MPISWEGPPDSVGGAKGGKWHAILEEVRSRPNQWAKVRADTRSRVSVSASWLRSAFKGWPAGTSREDFEIVCRGTNKESGLYVRYNPGAAS